MTAQAMPPTAIKVDLRNFAPRGVVTTSEPTRCENTLSQSARANNREYKSIPPDPFEQPVYFSVLIKQPLLQVWIPRKQLLCI